MVLFFDITIWNDSIYKPISYVIKNFRNFTHAELISLQRLEIFKVNENYFFLGKKKCVMGMFRKGNRLVSPKYLGFFNPHVMHPLLTTFIHVFGLSEHYSYLISIKNATSKSGYNYLRLDGEITQYFYVVCFVNKNLYIIFHDLIDENSTAMSIIIRIHILSITIVLNRI